MARIPRRVQFEPALPKFEADARYNVVLRRSIKIGRTFTVRPGQKVTLRGDIAEQHVDAIVSAEKV